MSLFEDKKIFSWDTNLSPTNFKTQTKMECDMFCSVQALVNLLLLFAVGGTVSGSSDTDFVG